MRAVYKYIYTLIFILFTLVLSGCEDLEVENENEPDAERGYNQKLTVENLAKGSYYSYWLSTHGTPNIHITSLVMADQFTASWANFGWQANSNEPRLVWDNFKTADNDKVTEVFFKQSYSNLNNIARVIHQLTKGGMVLGDVNKQSSMLALCYFVQGITHGQLGLAFDKAFIRKDANLTSDKIPTSSYKEMINTAIESLETAISYCDSGTFVLEGSIFNSTSVDNIYLKQLAHSYIARFMVLSSRTAAENNQVEWDKVLEHASAGITKDFGSGYDNLPWDGGKWYDLNLYYLVLQDWARIDCRILNLFDIDYPKQYPTSGRAPSVHKELGLGQALSDDKRLTTDFEYLSSVNFKPERGYYHYSHYRLKRFDNMLFEYEGGMILEFRQYENELMKAEAYAMLDQRTEAIAILNNANNPWKKRGGMPTLPGSFSKANILSVIFYERDIELIEQGFMLGFCDMRRRDMLQTGTPLHFPIPGYELELLNEPYYTFGGVENADGVNTSNGGWFKK